jgi:DNA invertase Pin-like site-specific DNA recombinase
VVSEISRLGGKMGDVLTLVELLHENGSALFSQQINLFTLENWQENPIS